MQKLVNGRPQLRLHGSTEGNLLSAIRSASRLREQPVHADTLQYWDDLLRHARDELVAQAAMPPKPLVSLISRLEDEIRQRPR